MLTEANGPGSLWSGCLAFVLAEYNLGSCETVKVSQQAIRTLKQECPSDFIRYQVNTG